MTRQVRGSRWPKLAGRRSLSSQKDSAAKSPCGVQSPFRSVTPTSRARPRAARRPRRWRDGSTRTTSASAPSGAPYCSLALRPRRLCRCPRALSDCALGLRLHPLLSHSNPKAADDVMPMMREWLHPREYELLEKAAHRPGFCMQASYGRARTRSLAASTPPERISLCLWPESERLAPCARPTRTTAATFAVADDRRAHPPECEQPRRGAPHGREREAVRGRGRRVRAPLPHAASRRVHQAHEPVPLCVGRFRPVRCARGRDPAEALPQVSALIIYSAGGALIGQSPHLYAVVRRCMTVF